MTNLSGNSVSRVYRDGPWITKRQPLYLTDNEWRGLTLMGEHGFSPQAMREDEETIKMMFLQSDQYFNPGKIIQSCAEFLYFLNCESLRHGDLTSPHIFIIDNNIKVIDWAESRYGEDPAPDKRREGDLFWMKKTIQELFKKSGIKLQDFSSEMNALR